MKKFVAGRHTGRIFHGCLASRDTCKYAAFVSPQVKNMQTILYDTLFALVGVENINSGYAARRKL
jgi:hypothetical protein